MASEASATATGRASEILERLQARLLPTLLALREQPWTLAAVTTTEPPSNVFRAVAPGEQWIPLDAAGHKAYLYLRWQPGDPSRDVVVRCAADAARAIAASITAEHRAERSAQRAARAERRWAKDHGELSVARVELERTRSAESQLRLAVADHEARASSFTPLAATAGLLAGIAHDVRSPLTAVLCNVSALEAELPSPSPAVAVMLADTRMACERIESVVGSVRPLTESPAEATRIDVGACVTSVLQILRLSLSRAGVHVETQVAASLTAVASSGEVCQILLHLLENALSATPRGGVIRVEGAQLDGETILRVTDSGPGIPASERAHAFTPFRSRKPGSLGVGLAVARTLARKHRGEVALVPSDPGMGGAIVEVRLPANRPAEEVSATDR